IVTGALIGSFGAEESSPTAVSDSEAAQRQHDEKKVNAFPGQTEDDVVGDAGEKLSIGELRISASEVTPRDDTFGARLCSKVSIENNSDTEVQYSTFDWKLQYPSGDIKEPTISSDDTLNHGEIAPGGTAEGNVCFEEAGEDGQYVLISERLLRFSSERGAWISERYPTLRERIVDDRTAARWVPF